MSAPWYAGWDCAEEGHLFEMGATDCVVCGAPDDEPEFIEFGDPAAETAYSGTAVSG